MRALRRGRFARRAPTKDNDFTLRVRLDDEPAGLVFYDVTVTYETR